MKTTAGRKMAAAACAAMMMMLAAGCGTAPAAGTGKTAAAEAADQAPSAEVNIADLKTMGDVLGWPSSATSNNGSYYAYVFELNGTYYRAVAPLTPELSDQLFALEFDDPQYDEKERAILAPLELSRVDDLMTLLPDQEEMDSWKGRTVGELLDEGWKFSWFIGEDRELGLEHGLFTYKLGFEGTLAPGEEIDEETIRPLVVTSAAYDSLGDVLADLE